MGGLPLVGAHAVLTGLPEFESSANKVNSAVGNINRNFVGLTATSEGFGLTFGRAFSGVETALLGIAAVGAKVGKSLLKDIYDAGPIANIEKVYHNMTTNFGIDSEKLMKELRAASYGAVDDFELMQKANLSMIGSGKEFGKFFAESLPKLMKISRESAKAQGVDVEYAFNSITTGIKRMSPMILDNLGFQISLTEATEAYAASVGKTSKELSKEEKQMAVLNLVLAQGDDLINSTGGHMDNVQTTWIAWGTAISNARKRFAIELLPIMQKFMDLLGTPSGDALTGKAVQLGKAITNFILPALDKLFMIIGAIVSGPIPLLISGLSKIGIEGIKNLLDELGKVFSGEGMQPERLANIFKTAFGGLLGVDLAGELGRRLGQALQTVQTIIRPIVKFIQDGIATIQQVFADASTAGAGFFDGISATISNLWAIAQPVLQGIVDLVKNYFVSAFENAKRLIQDLQPTFQAVFNYISGLINIFVTEVLPIIIQAVGVVVDWLNEHWPEIQSVIQTVIDAVSGIINWFVTNILPTIVENFQKIVGWVQENWPLIKQTIETVLNAIWNVIKTVLDAIKGFWDEHGRAIMQIVDTVWGAIKGIISTVMDVIGGIIKTVMQIINGDWEGAWTTIKETVERLWQGIQDFISSAFQAVVVFLNDFLVKPLEKMWSDLWNGLSKVVTDIWNGIVKFLQDVVNGAIGIINGMIDAFNNTIGKVTGEIPHLKEVAWDTSKEFSKANDAMIASSDTLLDKVLGNVLKMKDGISTGAQGMADPLAKSFDGAKQRIVEAMNEILAKIGDVIAKATGITIPMPQVSPGGKSPTSPTTGGGKPSSQPSAPACFLSGTSILMVDDRQLPIEHVQIGMKVKAFSLDDNQLHVACVKHISRHPVFKYYFIRLSDDTCLDVTGEHPLYAPNFVRLVNHPYDNFVMVRDLEIGDELFVYAPDATAPQQYKPVTVRDIHEEYGEELVYNMTVEPHNTYLANMVLVHNKVQELAKGAILGGPTYLAGEAGSEVVAPLSELTRMIQNALASVLTAYADVSARYGAGGNVINQRGGDTYYQLTTQAMTRPGALAMEFKAMEMAHL